MSAKYNSPARIGLDMHMKQTLGFISVSDSMQ